MDITFMSCIYSVFLNFRSQVACDVTLYHSVFVHVSKDRSIFLLGLLDPEYAGITFLQHIKNHSPDDSASSQKIWILSNIAVKTQIFHFLIVSNAPIVLTTKDSTSSCGCVRFFCKAIDDLDWKRCCSHSGTGLPEVAQEVFCRGDPYDAMSTWHLPDWPRFICRCVDVTSATLPMPTILDALYFFVFLCSGWCNNIFISASLIVQDCYYIRQELLVDSNHYPATHAGGQLSGLC
jgi:hypothetical protein